MILFLISNAFAGAAIYVGYSGKFNNFNTIQQAVNQAAAFNPSSESNRITILIASGTYREQVIIQTLYVTFINDEPSKGKALITWYYGIGYKYYSASENCYYDASLAQKKLSKYFFFIIFIFHLRVNIIRYKLIIII